MRFILYYPLIVTTVILVMCVLPYIMAVMYGHVEPIFPYVSDAAAKPPQAALWSLLLFFVAISTGIISFYRYEQIKCIVNDDILTRQHSLIKHSKLVLKANSLSFYHFLLLALCLSGLAAVRSSELLILHTLCAILSLILAPVCLTIQAWISHQLLPITRYNPLIVVYMRFAFVVLATIAGLTTGAAFFLTILEFKLPLKLLMDFETRAKWRPEYGGYVAHCVSAAGEWLALLFLGASIATFYTEFTRFEVSISGTLSIHNDMMAVR